MMRTGGSRSAPARLRSLEDGFVRASGVVMTSTCDARGLELPERADWLRWPLCGALECAVEAVTRRGNRNRAAASQPCRAQGQVTRRS